VLGLGKKVESLRGWIESLGAWGPAVVLVLYVGATVAALPGSAITIACGALFGSVRAVILVSIASTAGASLSFLIARYFARDAVARWAQSKPKFSQLDRLTREHGEIIVAITRLVPLFPFNLLNYGFGLTGVPFWTYVFWSWLCMLPGTVLYVVGADAITTAIAEGRAPWVLIVILAAVIAILALLVRYAKRKLRTKEGEAAAQETSEKESP
jgi:uncharacterized membrane protein YdjX (TVP38/TMEM64 family)